jgi:hypothetical protein
MHAPLSAEVERNMSNNLAKTRQLESSSDRSGMAASWRQLGNTRECSRHTGEITGPIPVALTEYLCKSKRRPCFFCFLRCESIQRRSSMRESVEKAWNSIPRSSDTSGHRFQRRIASTSHKAAWEGNDDGRHFSTKQDAGASRLGSVI